MSRRRRVLGKVDPFCLVAVVPALCAAVLFMALGSPVAVAILLLLACLVLLFDAWANRPAPPSPPVRHRSRPESGPRGGSRQGMNRLPPKRS